MKIPKDDIASTMMMILFGVFIAACWIYMLTSLALR